MSITDYNLEEEELQLESYLRKTTAMGIQREAESGDDGNPTIDNIIKDEFESCNTNNGVADFVEKRVFCCKTSRSLYCPECCKVLVPSSFWPKRFIREQHDRTKTCRRRQRSSFPFQSIDIVLGVKERRTSSTGIQMMCMANMISEALEVSPPLNNMNKNIDHHEQLQEQVRVCETSNKKIETKTSSSTKDDEWWRNVTLYDLNRGDSLPKYSNAQADENTKTDDNETSKEGTYVLFPQEGRSVPISRVAKKIRRLVVLDIKWTRSYNVKLFSADHHKIKIQQPSHSGGAKKHNPLSPLNDLPFVHLEFPPQKSNFWRWHNRGDGMLSTIEAIYFAAREVSVALEQGKRNFGEDETVNDSNRQQTFHLGLSNDNEEKGFVDILWLFALQRSIIQERNVQEGRPVAFSEEAKALARSLRQQDPRATQ